LTPVTPKGGSGALYRVREKTKRKGRGDRKKILYFQKYI
jgi:hypothetical protein